MDNYLFNLKLLNFSDIFSPRKLYICMFFTGVHLAIALNVLKYAFFIHTPCMPPSKIFPDPILLKMHWKTQKT